MNFILVKLLPKNGGSIFSAGELGTTPKHLGHAYHYTKPPMQAMISGAVPISCKDTGSYHRLGLKLCIQMFAYYEWSPGGEEYKPLGVKPGPST